MNHAVANTDRALPVFEQHEYLTHMAKLYGYRIHQPENIDGECIKAISLAYGGTMESLTTQHGIPMPSAEISNRNKSREGLRAAVDRIDYRRDIVSSELRLVLFGYLVRSVGGPTQ